VATKPTQHPPLGKHPNGQIGILAKKLLKMPRPYPNGSQGLSKPLKNPDLIYPKRAFIQSQLIAGKGKKEGRRCFDFFGI
jgi:hypothetical protein